MPEGPSLVLLREETRHFVGRKVLRATGNSKIDLKRVRGGVVRSLRTWGKHFLIELDDIALRVHFLMFGSYTIDTRKPRKPRLRLNFGNGELNFYSCAIRELDASIDETYDFSADVMSDEWDAAAARRKLRANADLLVCDALLDQTIFSGVGNIIKNEVLFRIGVHPLSKVGSLPPAALRSMVKEARDYAFDFLQWKRDFVLRKHWLVHTRRTCPRCERPLSRGHLGVTDRRSFWCDSCQKLYGAAAGAPAKRIARKVPRKQTAKAKKKVTKATARTTRSKRAS